MTYRWIRTGALALMLSLILAAGVAVAQTGGDPDRGGQLFAENCAVCHGLDGKGRVGANLNEFPGIAVDQFLKETIARGVEGSVMPAWGQANGGPLSDQDIADIAAYIAGVFNATQPIAPAPVYVPPVIPTLPNIQADLSAGAVIYHDNCVVCHGDKGQGRIGAKLAKAWSGNIPEATIRVTVRDGVSGSVMPAWGQANGGPLSDEDISNVASYVLTLQPVGGSEPTPLPPAPFNMVAALLIGGLLVVLIVAGLVVYYRKA